MKIFEVLNKYDIKPEELDSFTTRREAFKKLTNFGKSIAFATIPAGVLAASTQSASAAHIPTVLDVLNFALTLEYLEGEYYTKGINTPGLIPAGKDMAIFKTIEKHEVDHVAFLTKVIKSYGGTPVAKPTFDFTAGGMFNPFNNYEEFLILAQAFEDTGVRAYKGQAGKLIDENSVLTAALQIHSVEARHASEVRRLRGLKGWITQANIGAGVPAAAQAVYIREDNLIQGGVDVTTVTPIGPDGITEAFDEPLTKEEVLTIAGLFIA
ncbi:ferritin-like domain-containing protein [Algoriphagus antarcticus]|uniref:Ferritin-like protein n=1 Tax=Algoriphagus antarcticus TaxID=238540 RepID=A0A3E0DXP7_9BACT|nr:ferritin-like domain-containing protein [Algoriphagus antarcticus]REG88349.1 ferritin-like protein [Algoriphagus antarcticus]